MRVTSLCDTINSFKIAYTESVQTDPAVVFDGNNYIVVWSDGRFDEFYVWLVAARVTPQGTVLDPGNLVGEGGSLNESFSDVAFDGSRCLAAWCHAKTAPLGVFGRFINSAAQPEGQIITVATTKTYENRPKIEFDGSNYLVVWADSGGSDFGIFGQLVAPDGQLVGNKITLALDCPKYSFPDLAFDGSTYLVVWSENTDIFGQRVATDGQLIGAKFRISENSSYTRGYPGVGVSQTNYLVVWQELHGSYEDIYGNIDTPVMIEEGVSKRTQNRMATIINGPLALSAGKKWKIYDVSGRQVRSNHLKPGIYFVEIDGQIDTKVVKIK